MVLQGSHEPSQVVKKNGCMNICVKVTDFIVLDLMPTKRHNKIS